MGCLGSIYFSPGGIAAIHACSPPRSGLRKIQRGPIFSLMRDLKRIAILCSGGDCAGMNPAIKQFTEYARDKGILPYAVEDGLSGLIANRIVPIEFERVRGILHRGGTVIGSSRCPQFHECEYRAKAAENLRTQGIDALVLMGGNGSFRALEAFGAEHDFPFVGIPATIDNDVFGSETCLGVDTSLNVIRHCLDEIRDTASSFKRAFIVETMGRDCGYLALVSAITSGAEICIVPEIDYDLDSITERVQRQLKEGRRYLIAVVSEGANGAASELKEFIQSRLGMSCRVTVLGHIQRGGSSTVLDRLHAFQTATIAIDELLKGGKAKAILYQNGCWKPYHFSGVVKTFPALGEHLLNTARRLSH